jgi:hypothetical protein
MASTTVTRATFFETVHSCRIYFQTYCLNFTDSKYSFQMCSRQHLKLLAGSLVFSILIFLNPEVSNLFCFILVIGTSSWDKMVKNVLTTKNKLYCFIDDSLNIVKSMVVLHQQLYKYLSFDSFLYLPTRCGVGRGYDHGWKKPSATEPS